MDLLKSILSDKNPNYGKNGYYLASSGSVAWCDIYTAMAKALAKRGVIDSPEVKKADDAALDKMAQALSCPKELVAVQLGGIEIAAWIGLESQLLPHTRQLGSFNVLMNKRMTTIKVDTSCFFLIHEMLVSRNSSKALSPLSVLTCSF